MTACPTRAAHLSQTRRSCVARQFLYGADWVDVPTMIRSRDPLISDETCPDSFFRKSFVVDGLTPSGFQSLEKIAASPSGEKPLRVA